MKTVAEAATYLDLADACFRPRPAEPANFRFGASGLLNDIVSVMRGSLGLGEDTAELSTNTVPLSADY